MGPPEKRDEGWFDRLYRTRYADIVRYGQRRLADPDAAAELAQDVFVIAWRRRDQVPDHSLPWLYGVARRVLANHWRARRSGPQLRPMTDTDAPGYLDAGADDAVTDLGAALATLPELDREILRLIGWEELTVPEAAQVLGCSRSAAGVRLHRARKRLLRAMSAHSTAPAGQPTLIHP